MTFRKLTIAFVLVAVLLSITSMLPASAQSDRLSIDGEQDCADGMTLTVNGAVGADETLLVAWTYMDPMYGFSVNQVALTDLDGTEHEIVIPHLALPRNARASYIVMLMTQETSDAMLSLLMFSMLMEQIPDESMIESTLGDLPVYGGELSASNCSIAGMQPTISNVEVDPEALQEGFAEFFNMMAEGMQ